MKLYRIRVLITAYIVVQLLPGQLTATNSQTESPFNDIQTPTQLTWSWLWNPYSNDLQDWQYLGGISGLTGGNEGNLFLIDSDNARVMNITLDCDLVTIIGQEGDGPGEFRHPTSLAFDSNNQLLWVHEVQSGLLSQFKRTANEFEFVDSFRNALFASPGFELEDSSSMWFRLRLLRQNVDDPIEAQRIHLVDVNGTKRLAFGQYEQSEYEDLSIEWSNSGAIKKIGDDTIAFVWAYRPRIEIWKNDGTLLKSRDINTEDLLNHEVVKQRAGQSNSFRPYFRHFSFLPTNHRMYLGLFVSGTGRYDIYGLDIETLALTEWYQFEIPDDPMLAIEASQMIAVLNNGQICFLTVAPFSSGILVLTPHYK